MHRLMAFTAGIAALLAGGAAAQQPAAAQAQHVRGKVVAVTGDTLEVKSGSGETLRLKLTEDTRVSMVEKADMGSVSDGAFIGTTAVPQSDGTLRALEVHLFPDSMRGTGEGHRPWDLQPGSTMTNATVASQVTGTDGQTLTVTYKDGEKKVIVPPDTPIVTFVAAEKSELKPGARIIIFGATKKEDGTLEASRVNVGMNGIMPPM